MQKKPDTVTDLEFAFFKRFPNISLLFFLR